MTAREPELGALVLAARRGEPDAFAGLVAATRTDLVARARAMAGAADAEDVAHEAYLAAWPRLHALREPALFRSWMRRIAARLATRARRRRGHVEGRRAPAEPSEPPRQDERLALDEILARLTPRQRSVLALTAEGHADREIAARLGIEAATVRVHRVAGRRRLRAALLALMLAFLATLGSHLREARDAVPPAPPAPAAKPTLVVIPLPSGTVLYATVAASTPAVAPRARS